MFKVYAKDTTASEASQSTWVFNGPENVRLCVPSWSDELTTDPVSLYLLLVILFKRNGGLKANGSGLKVTVASTSAARDGVLPFVIEDEFHTTERKAVRSIRSCQLANELVLSSQDLQSSMVIQNVTNTFSDCYSAVLLEHGVQKAQFMPFDDWKHMLRVRSGFDLRNCSLKQAVFNASTLLQDLSVHYEAHEWWGQSLDIMDIAVASYVHCFDQLGPHYSEFKLALQSKPSLHSLRARVFDFFT